jgi:RNA polymerase sigma factor (sigma-70 family)
MASGRVSPVVRFLRRLVGEGRGGGVTDGQLLERFVRGRDEAAFAVLVERHGPLVLGVCRRVLDDAHAAEDAFQATFLVLVRKAGSIARPEQLGNWLYGVAYRTAARARGAAARRRAHERRAAERTAGPAAPEPEWPDLRAVLDEELARLTQRYRAPLVLCYLEGKTTEEAARELGCPRGTVLSRLARGREQLRRRLVRRGLAPSAGLPAALLAGTAGAAVPAPQAETTRKAALAAAAGNATGAVSPRVAALTEGVLRAMFLTKLKTAAAVAAVGLLLLAGGLAGTHYALGDKPGEAKKEENKGGAPPAGKAADAREDRDQLQGYWDAVSVTKDGEELGAEEREAVHVRFKGDEITFYPIRDKARVTFRLDPASSPKAITLTEQEGDDKGASVPGIYELNGDRLKLCIVMKKSGAVRPTEFVSPRGEDLLLLDLKREPKQVAEDKEKIQGTWQAVKMESEGREATEDEVKKGKFVIKGDKLTTVRPDGFTSESDITIDPAQRPKTIDLVPQTGPDTEKGKTFRGIYKLDGDTLILCMNGPEMERPKEFKTEAGTQVMLITLKREAPAEKGKDK